MLMLRRTSNDVLMLRRGPYEGFAWCATQHMLMPRRTANDVLMLRR
jgi:hypothetical protein